MGATHAVDSSGLEDTTTESYWIASTRPFQVLVFLLPLVALYEFGSFMWLDQAVAQSLAARAILRTLFELFGIAGVHIPAIALVTILISWHLIERRPWTARLGVTTAMGLESLVWAMPLLVLAAMTGVFGRGGGGLEAMSSGARATIAIGAGVYEELVFRFALMALIHGFLVDICGVRRRLGDVMTIAASAFVFAAYHNPVVIGSDGVSHLDSGALIFFLGSGVFLAGLFLGRGLGIAVGAHVIYDLVVLVAVPAFDRGGG
ncbi:MAG TPA: CPBP family intramembrane metalloprotease [Phycisphaerales bacterium]|nr:CPBP family intramembrane metalloprotease [Phycisphaerales bacterium]